MHVDAGAIWRTFCFWEFFQVSDINGLNDSEGAQNKASFGLRRVNYPYLCNLLANIIKIWNCPYSRGATPEILWLMGV